MPSGRHQFGRYDILDFIKSFRLLITSKKCIKPTMIGKDFLSKYFSYTTGLQETNFKKDRLGSNIQGS